MAIHQTSTASRPTLTLLAVLARSDRVVLVLVLAFGVIALVKPASLPSALAFVAESLLWIAPFLALSVAVAAYASASGADGLIAGAFRGRPIRMIAVAALFGALSPFCSCGVIPIIAGLLAAGGCRWLR